MRLTVSSVRPTTISTCKRCTHRSCNKLTNSGAASAEKCQKPFEAVLPQPDFWMSFVTDCSAAEDINNIGLMNRLDESLLLWVILGFRVTNHLINRWPGLFSNDREETKKLEVANFKLIYCLMLTRVRSPVEHSSQSWTSDPVIMMWYNYVVLNFRPCNYMFWYNYVGGIAQLSWLCNKRSIWSASPLYYIICEGEFTWNL